MRPYSLAHLSDAILLRDLKSLVARDRATTAALLAHIAEVDARRLYAPAGHSSMFVYCVAELGLSEDAAYRRITAARAARKFPALFGCVADGRLNLTAIGLLMPHLDRPDAEALLAESIGRSKAELEQMLARRFGASDLPTRVRPVFVAQPEVAGGLAFAASDENPSQLVPERVEAVPVSPAGPAFTPKYRLEVTIDEATHAKLRRVQALLGHVVPSGDVAQVLDRAFDALIEQVEKRKFAATANPRAATARQAHDARHVPAHVRRAVRERDGSECTFVGENGRRCRATRSLEFDHAVPVARGGLATVENLRLRCRAHNQHEAERAFGREFMEQKRGNGTSQAPPHDDAADVLAGLRNLGFRAEEARRGAQYAATLTKASLEDRFRAALRYLRPARITNLTASREAVPRVHDGPT